jgi:MFS family permease
MSNPTVRQYLTINALMSGGMSFTGSTYAIYLYNHGLNALQINLVNLCFWGTRLLMEIPTGRFADRYGRILSGSLSAAFLSVGMLIYALSSGFPGFALGEVLSAIGSTLGNGAILAWLVDRLDDPDNTKLSPILSRSTQLSQITSLCCALLGGFMADHNARLPWLVAGALFLAVSIWMSGCLSDGVGKPTTETPVQEVTPVTMAECWKNPSLRSMFIFVSLYSFAVQGPNMQWALWYKPQVGNTFALGLVYVGISLSIMLGARAAPWVLRKLQSEWLGLLLSLGVFAGGIFLATQSSLLSFSLAAFFLHEFGRGSVPAFKDSYLNRHIRDKSKRATLLSMSTFPSHVGGCLGLVVTGKLAVATSIPTTWGLIAVVLLVGGLYLQRSTA